MFRQILAQIKLITTSNYYTSNLDQLTKGRYFVLAIHQ